MSEGTWAAIIAAIITGFFGAIATIVAAIITSRARRSPIVADDPALKEKPDDEDPGESQPSTQSRELNKQFFHWPVEKSKQEEIPASLEHYARW